MLLMRILRLSQAGVSHPFGDARTVQQAFPASGVNKLESDPFLMCDYFDMVEKNGISNDPDDFPIDWHPHRGFDIASYLKSGVGRHGDSLGNRETYETPGMQWISTGSGVEHAEGGGTQKGDRMQGFQIWVNVPAKHKMDPPKYGTVPPDQLPTATVGHNTIARVLAGSMFDLTGPFETKQSVQMIDFELQQNGSFVEVEIAADLDTAILYVYQGSLASINNARASSAPTQSVVLLDASNNNERGIRIQAASPNTGVLLFAGKKLKERIVWHGSIVMSSQMQVAETMKEIQSGEFPPVRVPWNYRQIGERPKYAGATADSEL
jgi:redox-sensitive bicupin YhaK (pirin superfamily)